MQVVQGEAVAGGEVADRGGGQAGDLQLVHAVGAAPRHRGRTAARRAGRRPGCVTRDAVLRRAGEQLGHGQVRDEPALPMTTRWSAVSSISLMRCEERKTVRPSAARARSSSRIQRMPSGSRPLTGSSSITTSGSPSSAAAMPSRWPMPSEKPPARAGGAAGSPTRSSTSSTRRAGCRWSRRGRAGGRRRSGRLWTPWRRAARRPRASGTGRSPYALPPTSDPAPGRGVEAQDQPHGGRLAGAVRAEEAGHPAGPDGEAESSTAAVRP